MANSRLKKAKQAPVHCVNGSAIGMDVHANLLVCCYQSHEGEETKQDTAEFVSAINRKMPELEIS